MLRKKYHIDREFNIILHLFGEMDEQMTQIDHLLCDDKLLELMSADFSKRYPLSSKTGRKSTPVEVIFRMLTLKHLRSLSYEKKIKNVKESLILRQYWHNGVEGRISFLKRCFGFQRCLYRGDMGLKRWVGWGIIAHNLTIISRGLISQTETVK